MVQLQMSAVLAVLFCIISLRLRFGLHNSEKNEEKSRLENEEIEAKELKRPREGTRAKEQAMERNQG